jgi:hypothetical protein
MVMDMPRAKSPSNTEKAAQNGEALFVDDKSFPVPGMQAHPGSIMWKEEQCIGKHHSKWCKCIASYVIV